MIMRLGLTLPHDEYDYILYLDNLFTSVPLGRALKECSIGMTGTTRKNSKGTPQWILDLKKKNKDLVWDSALGEVVDGVLVFLWQDNNAVIGKILSFNIFNRIRLTGVFLVMSTVHSIHLPEDVIERLRRRPKATSTNAKNVREVFSYNVRLNLFIPVAIDAYNHHMNGVDVANQRRKHLTTQRKHIQRIWRPLFHWLLDITLTNCFLLWRLQARRKDPKVDWDPVEFNRYLASALFVYDPKDNNLLKASQGVTEAVFQEATEAFGEAIEEVFQETAEASQEVAETSLNVRKEKTYKTIAPQRCRGVLLGIPSKVEAVTDMKSITLAKGHDMQKGDYRRECVGCKIDGKTSRGATSERERQFGTDLTNVEFAKKVNTMCLQCNVYLCKGGRCWERYHNSKKY